MKTVPIHRAVVLAATLAAIGSGCVDTPQPHSFVEPGNGFDVGEASPDADTLDMGAEADQFSGADTAPPPIPMPNGSGCVEAADCANGACLVGDEWPGGFCTTAACQGGCGDSEGCAEQPQGGDFCTPQCGSDDECRSGYACDYVIPGSFREPPQGPRVCMPPRGLPDGEACSSRDDCQGFCLRDYPGGYCSTFGCETSDDCARQGLDNVCLVSGRFSQCARACSSGSDCRESYICEDIGGGTGICLPDPAQPFDPAVFDPSALNVTCGFTPVNGTVDIPFQISEGTTSYMVTPMTRDGQPMQPQRVAMPSGNSLSFLLANQIFAVGAQYLASMNPLMVPMAPKYDTYLETGAHTFTVDTDAAEVCYYLVEESEPGNVLDVNIYLVGLPGISAQNAATEPNMQQVVSQFETIYDQIGIDIGEVRYFDLSADDTARFETLRSESEIYELVKRSKAPGSEIESLLSVNIFFTAQFAMRGVLGISVGLPGAAGLHGTHGSGVVFTAEYMGQDFDDGWGVTGSGNEYTGLILAHEVGHFLGLFHTTESSGGLSDPLADTPECGQQIHENCPDVNNLMFPIAGHSHLEMTAEQGQVLGYSTLTRAAQGE